MTDINGTTFLSGANAEFIAELYARYLDEPEAVDESWRRFFAEIGDDPAALRAERNGPTWAPAPRPAPTDTTPASTTPAPADAAGMATAGAASFQRAATDSIRALNL